MWQTKRDKIRTYIYEKQYNNKVLWKGTSDLSLQLKFLSGGVLQEKQRKKQKEWKINSKYDSEKDCLWYGLLHLFGLILCFSIVNGLYNLTPIKFQRLSPRYTYAALNPYKKGMLQAFCLWALRLTSSLFYKNFCIYSNPGWLNTPHPPN